MHVDIYDQIYCFYLNYMPFFKILPPHLARYYLLHAPTSLLPYASAFNVTQQSQ